MRTIGLYPNWKDVVGTLGTHYLQLASGGGVSLGDLRT